MPIYQQPRQPIMGGASLNSAELTDGDSGWIGFNNRVRPDQLPRGMLADAQNVRIDRNNEVQARKGIELKSNAGLETGAALTLPFYLLADDLTITTAVNGSGEIEISGVDVANWDSGIQVQLSGIDEITPNPNGLKNATKVSDTQIKITDQTYSSAAAVFSGACLTFNGVDNESQLTISDNADLDISTNLTVSAWAKNDNAGLSDFDTIVSKYEFSTGSKMEWSMQITSAEKILISLSEDGGVSSFWNSDEAVPILNQWNHYAFVFTGGISLKVYLNGEEISGSFTLGTLPSSLYNGTADLHIGKNDSVFQNIWEGQICAVKIHNSSLSAEDVRLVYLRANPSESTLAAWYPMNEGTGTTITDTVNGNNGTMSSFTSPWANTQDGLLVPTVKYAFLNNLLTNRIYGSAAYSDPNEENSEYIIIATNSKAIAIDLLDGSTTDIAYPGTNVVSSECDVLQAFNKVFIFRDGQTAFEWDGSFTGTPAFTLVSSGTYTQPVTLNSATNTVIADGLATVTETGHGLSVGNSITIIENATNPGLVDEEYVIAAVPDANTFKYYITADDESAHTVSYMKKQSVGLGYTYMPAPPFAIYHQRRLVMPYRYTVDATANSFTDRGIRDELIASDILDSDTYDTIYAQYRFNAGTADYIVGLHSFAEDRVLVFCRNSVHLIDNTTNLSFASTRILSDEVGCVARKTIYQVGNRVIFLSDNGVYSTEFIDEYNLRGTETPLSEPINATIQRINKDAWVNSVATYYDNRYYIAVPLDDSTWNNAMLVFNFLNNQWESIDTVNDANFNFFDLIVAGYGSNRGVYAVNDIGSLYKIESRVDGIDRVITTLGGTQQNLQVQGDFTTRQYTAGTAERKKWNKFEMHVQSADTIASDFDINVISENRDTSELLGSLEDYVGNQLSISEDVSIRGRVGNRRAYGLQFQVNNMAGRPRVSLVEVNGMITFKSLKKAE